MSISTRCSEVQVGLCSIRQQTLSVGYVLGTMLDAGNKKWKDPSASRTSCVEETDPSTSDLFHTKGYPWGHKSIPWTGPQEAHGHHPGMTARGRWPQAGSWRCVGPPETDGDGRRRTVVGVKQRGGYPQPSRVAQNYPGHRAGWGREDEAREERREGRVGRASLCAAGDSPGFPAAGPALEEGILASVSWVSKGQLRLSRFALIT